MTVKVFLENGQILTYHTSSQQAAEWLRRVLEGDGFTVRVEEG